MNWLLRKLRNLLFAFLGIIVLLIVLVIAAYAAHSAGVIEDPMVYIERFRSIDWKAQASSLVGGLFFAWLLIDWLDNPGGYSTYYRPMGGVRHGNQVTFTDNNRNGIPDEYERRY